MNCEMKGSFEGGGGGKTEWRLKYTFRKNEIKTHFMLCATMWKRKWAFLATEH